MKNNTLISVFLILCTLAKAQNFSYSTSKNFGTTGNDIFGDAIRLPNGETIICGVISAASNDHPGNLYGNKDYWIVKTDAFDNIIWEKTLGGSGDDVAYKLLINSVNDIYVIGFSDSPADGNKTIATFGGNDIWIVKIDQSGNLLNQFDFGSNGSEMVLYEGAKLGVNDELILSCTSSGGISGNKTSNLIGISDIWLLKLDSNGNILNDVTIGGTSAEYVSRISFDGINSIYVAASSISGISGSKTSPNYGNSDIWLVKLDYNFNILAQNSFGGTDTDLPSKMLLSNNSLFVSGGSRSPISGNKTAPKYGIYDGLVLKLDTSNLNIINQATFGGTTNNSSFYDIIEESNNIIVTGIAKGPSNNFKDANSFGGYDIWMLGIDSSLNPLWNQTYGGNLDDGTTFINVIHNTTGTLEFFTDAGSASFTGNLNCDNYGSSDLLHYTLSTNLSVYENNPNRLKAYPNPVIDLLSIQSSTEEIQLFELLSYEGKRLGTYSLKSGVNTFNLSFLSPGSYLLKSNQELIQFVKL